jgi:hypothetical protein
MQKFGNRFQVSLAIALVHLPIEVDIDRSRPGSTQRSTTASVGASYSPAPLAMEFSSGFDRHNIQ